MGKKILIDLMKYRDHGKCSVEAIVRDPYLKIGYKTVRELATFFYTCRKCENAPCVAVCPVEALEKDTRGIIGRALNLCVRCKTCVAVCPFGTLMDDLFEKKERKNFLDLDNDPELEKFIEVSDDGIAMLYEGEEDLENHIYKLTEKVFVREYTWNH